VIEWARWPSNLRFSSIIPFIQHVKQKLITSVIMFHYRTRRVRDAAFLPKKPI
jgi:hypothetical protein